MNDLYKKTVEKVKEKKEKLKNANSWGKAFKFLPIFILEFLCSLRYLPHFLKSKPYSGFQELTSRDERGVYKFSYSTYLKYKKYSLAILTLLLFMFGLGASFFIFNFSPRTLEAAGGKSCSTPYHVVITSPSSNLEVCRGDTFTMAGYWYDNDSHGVCMYAQPYEGLVNGSTITTTTPIKISSGSYSGNTIDGQSWSKTVTANSAGSYEIKFEVSTAGFPLASYYSAARTITVNDRPGFFLIITHSANTENSITWSWQSVSGADNYRIFDTSNNNKSGDLSSGTLSWQETSLSPNTQYSRYGQAVNSCGARNSFTASAYTSIETPSGISFDEVTKNSITVSASGTISNLTSGSSGLYFSESVTSSDSGWLQSNSWQKTSLSPNTQYSFSVKARNGDGDETSVVGPVTKYTLAADPDVSANVDEDSWTNSAMLTFTNNAGFGAGGVEYYRYVFDQNPTHTWTDTETQWNSGTKQLTMTNEGSWYLHIKAYNAEDIAAASGATLDLGPFNYDTTEPRIINNVSDDDRWLNSAINYDVDFFSDGGAPLDYAQYAVGSSQGGNDIIDWTDIFTEDALSYTAAWSVAFNSLPEGTSYVSFRVYDKAGNKKEVLNDGFIINKDTIPATLSSLKAEASTTSATIIWTTNEPATTQVAYGLDQNYGSLTQEDTTLSTNHSVTITGLTPNQTYHFKPISKDRAENESNISDQIFATSQLEATVITDVKATVLSPTSVKITWTTNHAADSKVRYGLTTAYGQEKYDAEKVTNHSITLTGLQPGTTYHYEVLSTGNTSANDADATFTTNSEEEGEEEDSEKESPSEENVYVPSPTIVKTEVNPISDGATIDQAYPIITGLARSNNTIFIFIDGQLENTVLSTNHPSGTGSFAYKLRRILPEGEHTLYTISRDADGHYSERSPVITFTVDYPYVAPTLYEPVFTDGENPSIVVNGVARNNSLIKVYVDGEYKAEFRVKNNPEHENTYFAYTYPITQLSDGQHTLQVKAFSPSGEASKFSNTYTFEKRRGVSKSMNQFIFNEGIKYRVVSGDSLWKIAERFYGNGSRYKDIINENREKYPSLVENPNAIQIGWTLSIP